jgi:hypothetical protein
MEKLFWVIVAFILSPFPAAAQVFDVPIPGIGRTRATIGFSPGYDHNNCTALGAFPGDVTTPFFVYAWLVRLPETGAGQVNREIRIIYPSGKIDIDRGSINWGAHHANYCAAQNILKLPTFGDHRFQFIFNGVEVGRLTLTVQQR